MAWDFPAMVARIETAMPDFLGRVFLAADVDGARREAEAKLADDPDAAGFVYLIAPAEKGRPDGPTGVVEQRVDVSVGLCCIAYQAADPSGAAVQARAEAIRQPAMRAIHGWKPGPEFDVLRLGGGYFKRPADGWCYWFGEFSTSYFLSSPRSS
jgi:hypothetical protein